MPFRSPFTTTAEPGRSIHFRRRWAYTAWGVILLASLGAWGLWERPKALASADLEVRVKIRQAPPDVTVTAWAGPWARFAGPEQFRDAPIQVPLLPDGTATLPVFHMPIAYRRWVRGYIPRDTWDLVVLRFTAPGQGPRYLGLPLAKDIRNGFLLPRHKMTGRLECAWTTLRTDTLFSDE
jgi:hypothetical protein